MYTNYADSTQFLIAGWSIIARECAKFDLAIGGPSPCLQTSNTQGWVLTVYGLFEALNMDAEIQQLVEMVRNSPWYPT